MTLLPLFAAVKYGIEEIPSDVVALISHATQERLKTLVQKLGVVAEHRLENIKVRKDFLSSMFPVVAKGFLLSRLSFCSTSPDSHFADLLMGGWSQNISTENSYVKK